jgi:hypothetical protein
MGRVARWYIFREKLVNFGRPWYGTFLCASCPFGIFIVILIYFMAIWYVCGCFGTFPPILFFLHQEKSGNVALRYNITAIQTKARTYYICTNTIQQKNLQPPAG